MTTDEIRAAVEEYTIKHGIQYTADFVCKAQPLEKVKSPQLNWNVTLTRNTRSYSFEYHEGCGHVDIYKTPCKTPYDRRVRDEAVRKTCETGLLWKWKPFMGWFATVRRQPSPPIASVLYCICMDYDVLQFANFEEWAGNFGYELDSRKAEKIYDLCVKQSLELKNVLGEHHITILKELLQEY